MIAPAPLAQGGDRGALVIRHLHGHCFVSFRHPRPERVRARLDRALQTHLVPALESSLRPVLESDAEGILLIHRLEARLTLNAGRLDEAVLGRAIGRHMAAEIARVAERPANNDNVRYFPNWASYVAQYLADCLAGRDRGAWHFRAFDGLAALPPGQALGAALLMRPASAWDALERVAQRGDLLRLVQALLEGDASRVLDALRDTVGGPALPDRAALPALLAAWAGRPIPGAEPGSARHALGLWAAWLDRMQLGGAQAPGPAHSAVFWATADLLADLAALLAAAETPGTLLDRLLARDLSGALALVGPGPLGRNAVRLAGLLNLFAGDDAALVGAAAVVAPQATATARRRSAGRIFSACAGFFWLLPSIVALQPEEWLDPAAADPQIAAVWRYWLALKCLGARSFDQAREDAGLLSVLGLEAAPAAGAQEAAATALAGPAGTALLKGLWAVLARQGRALGSPLALDEAALPDGRRAGLVRDVRRDDWLVAVPAGQDLAAAALEVQAAFGHRPGPDALFAFGDRPDPEVDSATREFSRKARPAGPDVAYLHLPALTPSADLALVPAARAILRTFAGGLLGFAWSSLPYLHANFLAGTATVEVSRDGFEVALPSPPLHSVLRMSGFRRDVVEPYWLGGRAVHLRWDEEG